MYDVWWCLKIPSMISVLEFGCFLSKSFEPVNQLPVFQGAPCQRSVELSARRTGPRMFPQKGPALVAKLGQLRHDQRPATPRPQKFHHKFSPKKNTSVRGTTVIFKEKDHEVFHLLSQGSISGSSMKGIITCRSQQKNQVNSPFNRRIFSYQPKTMALPWHVTWGVSQLSNFNRVLVSCL